MRSNEPQSISCGYVKRQLFYHKFATKKWPYITDVVTVCLHFDLQGKKVSYCGCKKGLCIIAVLFSNVNTNANHRICPHFEKSIHTPMLDYCKFYLKNQTNTLGGVLVFVNNFFSVSLDDLENLMPAACSFIKSIIRSFGYVLSYMALTQTPYLHRYADRG